MICFPYTARVCAACFAPNIGQNDDRTETPDAERSRAPDCCHQGKPPRGPRPLPAAADVPAWPAGVRGVRNAALPGRCRKPGAACVPAEKGAIHHPPAAHRRAAGHQGMAGRARAHEAGRLRRLFRVRAAQPAEPAHGMGCDPPLWRESGPAAGRPPAHAAARLRLRAG